MRAPTDEWVTMPTWWLYWMGLYTLATYSKDADRRAWIELYHA